MVKSIIKRIIVGVGIALCLMAIKERGLVGQVHAETFTPKSITYNLSNGSPTDTIRYKVLDNIPVYYYSYGGQVWMSSISFNYSNFSNNLMNKPLNFSGTFYTTNRTDTLPEPFRVWVLDNNTNTTYACTTQSSGQASLRGSTSYWNTFTCSNVVITFSEFRIYVGSNFYSDGEIGISKINIQHSELSDISNTTNDINNTTKDINNSLNDQSDANTSGFLQDINQDYSNNPVSDLITMPITFLQTLNNKASGSCITWDLGSLLGTNLKMPCINLQQRLGSTLYNLIDMAICLFLAYNIGLMCVTIWNNMTSLKDDFDDMYSPKHVYQGKHSGGDS